MPTIQRLLTDDTGQALVTAINNVVAAVKPNATEIQLSSSDTTTVATAITNINDKIGTIPSGQTVEGQITTLNSNVATYRNADGKLISLSTSLNDVKTSGRYYATWQCTNTPMPDAPGYVDVYAASDAYIKQSFYDAYSDKVYTRRCENGTWSVWEQLALNSNIGKIAYSNLPSVSGGSIGATIKSLIESGYNGGIYLSIANASDRPGTSPNYRIRYGMTDGSNGVLVEAWDYSDVAKYYVASTTSSAESISEWKQLTFQ